MESGRLFFAASATLVFACYVLTRVKRCQPTNETANCQKVLAENDTNTAAVSFDSSCGLSDRKSDIEDSTLYEKSQEIEEAKKSVKDQVLRVSENLQQTSPHWVDDVLKIEVEEVKFNEQKYVMLSENKENTDSSPFKEQSSETLAEVPLPHWISSCENENTVDRFCDAHSLMIGSNSLTSLPRVQTLPALAKSHTSPIHRKTHSLKKWTSVGIVPEFKPYKSEGFLFPKYITRRRRKPGLSIRLRRKYLERSLEEEREESVESDWRPYSPELSSTEDVYDNKTPA